MLTNLKSLSSLLALMFLINLAVATHSAPFKPAELHNQEWRFQSLLDDSELNGKVIYHIDFDSTNNVWLATTDGLRRYDGYSWQKYTVDDGLPSNFVRCVKITRDGKIWVGTDSGAGIFDDGTFSTLGSESGLAGPSVRRIEEDPDGTLWFSSDDWPPGESRESGLTSFEDGQWTVYQEEQGLPSNYVADYFRDSQGRQFALTAQGLALKQGDHWIQPLSDRGLSGVDDFFWFMTEVENERVLAFTPTSTYRLENQEWNQVVDQTGQYSSAINCRTAAGEILRTKRFSSHEHALFRWNQSGFERFSAPYHVGGTIEFMREAPDNSVWLMGFNNLIRWNGPQADSSEFGNLPPPRFVDNENGVWFFDEHTTIRNHNGKWESLEPIRLPKNMQEWKSYSDVAEERLFQWLKDKPNLSQEIESRFESVNLVVANSQSEQNGVWFLGANSATNNVVAYYDGSNWETKDLGEFASKDIRHFYVDSENELWLYVPSINPLAHDIVYLGEDGIEKYARISPVFEKETHSGLLSHNGTVWFFGDFGLYKFDTKTNRQWERINELGKSRVVALHELDDHIFIVHNGNAGGVSGITDYHNDHLIQHKMPAVHPGYVTNGDTIVFPAYGRLYFMSKETDYVPRFLRTHDLGIPAHIIQDHDGNFWGSSLAHVFSLRRSEHPSETVIQAATSELIIGSDLQISVQGINKFSPADDECDFRYSWKVDKGLWQPLSNSIDTVISVSEFTEGSHMLHVRSQNQHLQTDLTPATLSFTIHSTPIQERPWFMPVIAITFSVILLLSFLVSASRRRIALHAHDLENIVGARTSELTVANESLRKEISDKEKIAEELRQSHKMEALGHLAGGIAHDFNNILTAINGYAAMLLGKRGDDPEVVSKTKYIIDSGQRAARLTSQLLMFSRKQVLQPNPLNLNRIMDDGAELIRRLIGENIRLVLNRNSGLDYVLADPIQMEQIIMNLSINARDAMPHGGTLIFETSNIQVDSEFVRSHPGAEIGRYVMLAVSDTGIGMDDKQRQQIFEPFFTTKPPGKGTGMGLSVVYGIVKQSSGFILVESQLGKGTVFRVCLPRIDTPAQERRSEKEDLPPKGGSEHVLLVEDEEQVRQLMVTLLEDAGYRVVAAETAETVAAMEQDQIKSFDLLVTDVMLPGMNGKDLSERLIGINQHLKVLFVSGYSGKHLVKQGTLDTEVELLLKPFSLDVFLEKVRMVIDE